MRKDQVDKQAEAEALVRGAVNQPVSLSFLRGKQLKIVVELACEPDGLGLDGLAERCLVHDLDNLRRECQRLERNWGLLNSLAGAHGRQTWCLVGRLDLIQGRLFWTAQPESLPDKTRRMRAQSAGKRGKPAAGSPATRNTGSRYISPQTQLPENSVTGCAEAGNTGSCPAAGGLEKPAAGGPEIDKTSSCCDPAAQQPEKSASGESLSISNESLTLNSLESLDSSLNDQALERENRRLLKNAHLLFGSPVTWHASFAGKRTLEVLGWLAQAGLAFRQGRLIHPWGVVYKGLLGQLQKKEPDEKFLEAPEKYLPDKYLEACGLAHYGCRDCELEFGRMSDLDAHRLACHLELDQLEESESESEPIRKGLLPDPELQQAWLTIQDQLKASVPFGVYNKYIHDTWPVGWDRESGLLSVGVPSPESAAWLGQRLPEAVERLLGSILNCEVRIRLVVS